MNTRTIAPTLSLFALVSAHSLLTQGCGESSNGGSASGGAATGGASQPESSGGVLTGGSAARGGSGGNASPAAGQGGGTSSAGRDSTGGVPSSAGEGGVPSTGGEQNGSGAGGDSGAPGGGGVAGSTGEGGEGGSDGGAANGVPSIATILAEYRSYQPQTAQPEPVSAYIFGLCRLPTLKEQTFADSEHGDGRYLQDWANEPAVSGIARRGQPPFAVGSVIVKEKYVPGPTSGVLVLAARGFMIKREAGFAPANGDWDFAYWEPELGVLSTAEQSSYCGGCHAGAASTDFVFVDGLTP